MAIYQKLIDLLNEQIGPFTFREADYQLIIDKIGNRRIVLMGEATHGTEEFYQTRIELTKRLIQEKGFMAVAIEADLPDVYQVHRYVQGAKDSGKKALSSFSRFPMWMWRNTTLPPFINWLRDYNALQLKKAKIGFYGLDLYSLNASMEVVINYLSKIDPKAAERAKTRYACFDHTTGDPQRYGYLANIGIKKNCIKEAIGVLLELQHKALEYLADAGTEDENDYFFAIQNARLVKDAEAYYRSMFESHISSWNVRDTHMAETLVILANHLEKQFNRPAKIIVWAHNSHIGDARATEMGEQGEINLGQLVREQYDRDVYILGFSTFQGFVTAANNWDMPAEQKAIIPALEGSYEHLFHQLKYKNFILDLGTNEELMHFLQPSRLQRAIGVIYCPQTERMSHYFFTRLPYQFDSLLHFDKTNAVIPLD